jgi:hypothetical protein
VSPSIADVLGGTVLGIFGENFTDPMTIEVLEADLTVVGQAKYFEARLDLRLQKALVGFPALPAGSYGIRITTAAGTSPVLPDAVTYKPFASEGKVLRMRSRFARVWATGRRVLSE